MPLHPKEYVWWRPWHCSAYVFTLWILWRISQNLWVTWLMSETIYFAVKIAIRWWISNTEESERISYLGLLRRSIRLNLGILHPMLPSPVSFLETPNPHEPHRAKWHADILLRMQGASIPKQQRPRIRIRNPAHSPLWQQASRGRGASLRHYMKQPHVVELSQPAQQCFGPHRSKLSTPPAKGVHLGARLLLVMYPTSSICLVTLFREKSQELQPERMTRTKHEPNTETETTEPPTTQPTHNADGGFTVPRTRKPQKPQNSQKQMLATQTHPQNPNSQSATNLGPPQ